MRSSLNKIQEAEQFIQKQLPSDETLVYEAKLLTSPLMRWNTAVLKFTLRLVKLYHRKKLKKDVNEVHQNLFSQGSNSDLKNQIQKIFQS